MDGLNWAPTGVGPARSFGLRDVRRFDGIRVEVLEGKGTDGSPYRTCTYWFDDNGLLIARYDPCDISDAASRTIDLPAASPDPT